MVRKDIKIQINTILWENAVKKIETDFGKKYNKTDCMLIIICLSFHPKSPKTLVFSAFSQPRSWPFPLFFPLWGEIRESFFIRPPLPDRAALRKSAWLPL